MQKGLLPICPDTVICTDPHVWIPGGFKEFLKELEHIRGSCESQCPQFRGHADRRWLLESSFVRTCKKMLLGIETHVRPSESVRNSEEYRQTLFALLLLKHNVLVKPSAELKEIAKKDPGVDALFELLKRFQQYPEDDKTPLKGTFILDWTEENNVAIFFANFRASNEGVEERQGDGAVFVCDQVTTGKTLHLKIEEILTKMGEAYNAGEAFGCPLLFHPRIQIQNERANNQGAIYWAQMELGYDLELIWALQEQRLAQEQEEQYIFRKLVLPYESRAECAEYLKSKGVTHSYLFPPSRVRRYQGK